MFVLLAFQAFLSSIFASEFRAIAMKKLADDTRTGLEIMGREMRLAQKATNASCIANKTSFEISGAGSNMLKFIDFDGRCIEYNFESASKTLTKCISCRPSDTRQLFLGGNINVSSMKFSLIGAGNNQQPRVTIQINVEVDDPTKQGSVLSIPLQTTMSQREVNLVL